MKPRFSLVALALATSGFAQSNRAPSPSALGTLLVYLGTLGVVVAMLVFVLRYAKQNEGVVQTQLERLGVAIPSAPDSTSAKLAPPPPAPVAPIVLDASSHRLVGPDGGEVPLGVGELIVGRELGVGLSLLGEATVSRRHAAIRRSGEAVVVEDLGSKNGTYVGNVRIQEPTTVKVGDEIRFGSMVFRYEA